MTPIHSFTHPLDDVNPMRQPILFDYLGKSSLFGALLLSAYDYDLALANEIEQRFDDERFILRSFAGLFCRTVASDHQWFWRALDAYPLDVCSLGDYIGPPPGGGPWHEFADDSRRAGEWTGAMVLRPDDFGDALPKPVVTKTAKKEDAARGLFGEAQ